MGSNARAGSTPARGTKRSKKIMKKQIIKTPKYVGGYRLGGKNGLQFNFIHKPNWFHRTMMKLCFGWEWVNL